MSDDSTVSSADRNTDHLPFEGTDRESQCFADRLSIGSTDGIADCKSICKANGDTDCSTEHGGRFKATNTKSNAPSIVF